MKVPHESPRKVRTWAIKIEYRDPVPKGGTYHYEIQDAFATDALDQAFQLLEEELGLPPGGATRKALVIELKEVKS